MESEKARAEILADIDAVEVSLALGEGRTITQQSMQELADEVKQRGGARGSPPSDNRTVHGAPLMAHRWWPTALPRKLKRS